MKFNYKYLVFIGSFIFFLVTMVENFSASHDSINYLVGIAEGKNLVHTHHLLYHICTYGWVELLKLVFPGIKDYYLAASFSCLFGSGIITIAWLFFINRFFLAPVKAFAGICVIAFSYGMWFYSVNIEVYAPPLFFILLCIYYLSGPPDKNRLFKVFLFHFIAVLFHQVHILFSLVVLFFIWNIYKQDKYRLILQYTSTGILLVGGIYFITGWFIEGNQTPDSFMNWVLGYTYGHSYWQPLSLGTPVNVMTGFSHAIIGGHFIFTLSGPDGFIGRILSSHNLEDEMFIARNLGSVWSWIFLGLTFGFVFYFLKLLIHFFRNISVIRVRYNRLLMLLGGCFLLYTAFFIFWMPEILEFWIPQTVFMWLLLIGTLPVSVSETNRNHFQVVPVMAILLLIINYYGSIRWLRNINNDWYYQMTIPVKDVSSDRDLILVNNGWIIKDYLDYFTPSAVQEISVLNNWQDKIPVIDSVLQNGGKVYLYPGKSGQTEEPVIHSFQFLLDHYKGRMFFFYDKNPEIWVIE